MRTEQERDELKAEIVRLKEDGNLRKEFPERINFLAGTTAVKGPGVIVSIEDSKKIISNSDNTNLYIIHDEDILKAIGNAKSMEDAIKMRGGVAETLSVWGIQVDIKKDNNIVIPAYKGATEFKYVTAISQ